LGDCCGGDELDGRVNLTLCGALGLRCSHASPPVSADLRAELERVGVTYATAGPAAHVQVTDLGDGEVWFRGPPLSGLSWSGPRAAALELLAAIADGAGVEWVLAGVRAKPGVGRTRERGSAWHGATPRLMT